MIREFHQIDLSGRNSFGVGQQAARLAEFETEEDLRTIFSGGVPERWAVLSGGNNILFTRDYDGLLLTPVARQITPLGEEGDTVRVRADAGVEILVCGTCLSFYGLTDQLQVGTVSNMYDIVTRMQRAAKVVSL